MSSQLENLQEDIASHLRSVAELSGTEVVTRKQGDIFSKIEEQLTTMDGRIIIVFPPSGRVEATNIPGPQLDTEILIQAVENPLTNTGGPSALALAEAIITHLHLWRATRTENLLIAQALTPIDEAASNVIAIRFTSETTLPDRHKS